ncbi:MAG: serine hydrolase [Bacteroidota bacterium]
MTNRLLFILTLSFCFVLFFHKKVVGQSVKSTEFTLLAAKADTLLRDAIQYKEHVGLTAGIYADGQTAWTGGAGFRDLKAEAPANANMVNRTASIAKSMTAVAIMQLAEKGKLEVDATVQTYVPEFPKKPEGAITIRQLLTHTSGIPHYKGMLDGFSLREFKTLEKAVKRFQNRKLVGIPGAVYKYTTYGYVLLGLVIERCSGMAYEDYMKKYIWEVAEMNDTSVEHKKQEPVNKSRLYRVGKKGQLKKDMNTNISMKIPGGGLQTTAADLLKFGKALINHQLVSAETLEKMFYNPKLKKQGNPYIMGFLIYADDERGRIIGHSGAQAGTNTQMMILLDKGIVVSCLSNTRGGGNTQYLAWQLIDLALNKSVREAPIRKAITASPKEMNRFVGTYDFGKGQLLTISEKEGQLYSQVNKNPMLKLYVQDESTIFYRNFAASFAFEFDAASGQVSKTTYVQNGEAMYPKKIR